MTEYEEAKAFADEKCRDMPPGEERDDHWGFFLAQYGGLKSIGKRLRERGKRKRPA